MHKTIRFTPPRENGARRPFGQTQISVGRKYVTRQSLGLLDSMAPGLFWKFHGANDAAKVAAQGFGD